MSIIKNILTEELKTINKKEQRTGKPYFNSQFLSHHPYLCLGMLVCYIILAIVIWYAPYFGPYWLAGFTLIFILLAGVLLFDVKPEYRFEDIGVLDLRVCYNGEWFVTENISDKSLQEILASSEVEASIKQEISRLLKLKGELSFYDIYHIAYPEVESSNNRLTMANKNAQFQ